MITHGKGVVLSACRAAGALSVLFGVTLGAATHAAADVVRILHSDGDAIQARVDLVQQAKQEINVSYYIVSDDDVPLLFLALLRDAARRGVTVRLLVDGHDGDNQMPRGLQAHLQCEGVQIQEYHPPGKLSPYWIKNRMHDKLLIVDGQHLITGGRNMKSDYFGLACKNFLDRDVYIRGCTAADARCYFMGRWNGCDTGPTKLDGKASKKRMEEMTHTELNCPDEASIACAAELLDEAMRQAADVGHVARLNTGRDWSAEAHEVSCIRFLHDSVDGKKTKCPGIADDMLELLAGARCSVMLETPYLVLSRKTKNVLASLRCRGVRVVILTNSAQTNNHHSAQAAYENDKRWYLRHGIELWELTGCDHLHAKAAVIDGCIAVIGSYNFDYLSEKRNSEVAVAIHDQTTAAELQASINDHLGRCHQIGRNLRPIGHASRYPDTDRKTIKEIRRKRLIAPAVKRSL